MIKQTLPLFLVLSIGALVEAQPAAAGKRLIAETDVTKFVWSADPQVSADGKTVAFVRVDPNEKKDEYETSIWIAATDGKSHSQLGPFNITVTSTAATGSATLSWQPPTENADGSPLTNLAGYVIRYGTRSDALTLEVKISNPGITTAMIEDLAPAKWYFTVSAYTSTGVESMPSAVGSKTVT